MLSNTSVVGSRCDNHRDTKLCCFFYINRIVSYACTSDYFELRAVFYSICITFCNSYNKSICILHLVKIIVRILIVSYIYISYSI